ncbi:clathrin light chain [Monosporozyma servazzii]
MSEKYPALDNEEQTPDQTITPVDNQDETDFLKREAEILGDEFKTEQDADLLDAGDNGEDDEFDDFTSNNNEDTTVNEATAFQDNDTTNNNNTTNEPVKSVEVNDDAQRIISEWEESHQKEIEQRDQRENEEKSTLQNEAITYIDEFYETYNNKKQEGIEASKSAAKQFIEKRDEFFKQEGTTTWDRAFQLINEEDAAVVSGRDRTKFKEILQRLQGKVDAPGA